MTEIATQIKQEVQGAKGQEVKGKAEALHMANRMRLRGEEGAKPGRVLRELAGQAHRPDGPKMTSRSVMEPVRGEQRQSETGGLTQRELKSLSFSFDGYFKKNPPIEGVFDPDTAVNTDPRQEQLLVRQQEALMKCRTLIESYIERDEITNDPAVARAKLKGMVDTFGHSYGFTDRQSDMTGDLIDTYYNHRQEGIDLRRRYPPGRDRELARLVTGADISDKAYVHVEAGPWGLVITTDNDVINNVLYRGATPPTDFIAGGLADISAHPPYILTNRENSDKNTVKHEGQHIRYQLNKEVFARHDQDILNITQERPPLTFPVDQRQLEEQMLFDSRVALDRAKDEIFAFTFNFGHFPIGLFQNQSGNPYDYLKPQRDWAATIKDSGQREAAQRIVVDEYRAKLTLGAASFSELMKQGYSNSEAIALLIDKPMEQWSDTARKLLLAKGIEPSAALYQPEPIAQRTAGEAPMDVVIRSEDKKPDWYDERVAYAKKKKEEAEAKPVSEQASAIDADMTLSMLNKTLYDRTRSQVDFYNKLYGAQGLEDYFTVLDQVTTELGGSLQYGKIEDQDVDLAMRRIYQRLESMYTERNEQPPE